MVRSNMFDDSEKRHIPPWFPFACFGVAAILYVLGQSIADLAILQDLWWMTVPLGVIALLVKLRSNRP